MPDAPVSEYSTCTDPVAEDILYLVDISEAAAADRTKKITFGALLGRVVVNKDVVVCNKDTIVTL